jgi:hypothetical protein
VLYHALILKCILLFFKKGHAPGKKDNKVKPSCGEVNFGAERSLYTCDESPKKPEDQRMSPG